MADLVVTVDSQGSTITPSNTTLTTSNTTAGISTTAITTVGIQGASGAAVPISENVQVDVITEGLNNGSVLVYKTNTSKWTATKNLNLQNVDSGEY